MDRTERFYLIDGLLRSQRQVSRQQFLDRLEVSPATFKRDLEYLRDRMGAPIEYSREFRGYRYRDGETFSLPGFWLSSGEIHALLAAYELISSAARGPLEAHLRPIRDRIESVLERSDHAAGEVRRRIRVCESAARRDAGRWFPLVADAVLSRMPLRLRYHVRSRDELTERAVSPQRLVHYRDNWYLDAWCHWRGGLRSFSLDAIRHAEIAAGEVLREVPEKTLDRWFASSYGIFSGRPDKTAKIRFRGLAARYVSAELWHPEQRGRFDRDGRWVLELPYREGEELIMDLMRYGADAEVLAPASLRREVAARLAAAAAVYRR